MQPATSTLLASPARTADRHAGNAKARSSGYSFLGGIGIGNHNWPVGAFAGYFNSRQRISALGAATRTDDWRVDPL